MYTNVNLAAPIGVLAFLGTAMFLLVAGFVLIYSLATKKPRLGKLSAVSIAVVGFVYISLMLVYSFASSKTALARGQEKHFCEIDCHLAYSIIDVRQSKTLGDPANQTTAAGLYHVITIKTRFDETTINPSRGNGLLYPNSRVLTVIDENGRVFYPTPEAHNSLEQSRGADAPMTTPLRPTESYTSRFVFDLPTDVRNPVLLINEGDWVTHFVIGHENSLWHKKTAFQI
jgi:hypothetical protein